MFAYPSMQYTAHLLIDLFVVRDSFLMGSHVFFMFLCKLFFRFHFRMGYLGEYIRCSSLYRHCLYPCFRGIFESEHTKVSYCYQLELEYFVYFLNTRICAERENATQILEHRTLTGSCSESELFGIRRMLCTYSYLFFKIESYI